MHNFHRFSSHPLAGRFSVVVAQSFLIGIVSLLLLFSLPVCGIPAESPCLVLSKGSRTPIATVLDQLGAADGPELVLAQDIHGVIVAEATTQLTLEHLLQEFLPANGFYTYRSPEKNVVVVSRDLVDRHIPLPREVNRGLRRAAALIQSTTQALDFHQAIEQVLLGKQDREKLSVEWPERSLRLTANPSELAVCDTRTRVRQIQESLAGQATQLAAVPPIPLVIKAIALHATIGQPFIKALNENFYGGCGLDGNSWDGTPYLSMSADGSVLVVGHTAEVIEQARQLASRHPYKIQLPDLALASRRYQAVSDKTRQDLSHSAAYQRRHQVEVLEKIFETILYESGQKAEAAARGRLLLPNPDEGAIVVIDTEENLKKVDEYMHYRDISTGAATAKYGRSTTPYLRAVQVQHRSIDQAARAFGMEP